MRLMVRSKGYDFLKKQLHWPLLSFRTLARRLETLQFIPGKTDDILRFLPDRVIDPENPASNLCVMSFDEMKIEEEVAYDKGLKRCLGLVTPCLAKDEEEEEKLATHALVVILRGITGHWKLVISYAYTTQHTKPEFVWEYLKSLIVEVHGVRLKVCMLSPDMSGQNTAIGNLLSVYSTRDGVQIFFPHPVPGEPDIIWNADAPHVFEHFWLQLTKTDMKLPEDVQNLYDLPSRNVSVKHVLEVLRHQNGGGAKLVPKLSDSHMNPSQFEKMKVGIAAVFFSEPLGMALVSLAEKGLFSKEAKTTGWFLLQVSKWYKLMVNRHIFDALGTDQHSEGRLQFLGDFGDLIQRVSFGGIRKPVQNGVALTTTAVLELHKKYVVNRPLDYFLTARSTTSGVENSFSQVREGSVPNPTAVRVRLMLRLMSVRQCFHVSKHSSYDAEDEVHAVDFLKRNTTDEEDVMTALQEAAHDVAFVDLSDINLSFVVESGLYYMKSHAASKANINCQECRNAVRSTQPLEIAEAGWTEMLSKGRLGHPTSVVYHVNYTLEKIFQSIGKKVLKMTNPLDSIISCLHQEISEDIVQSLPECHNALGLVVDKFVGLRLHVATKDYSKKEVIISYASKTAYQSIHCVG